MLEVATAVVLRVFSLARRITFLPSHHLDACNVSAEPTHLPLWNEMEQMFQRGDWAGRGEERRGSRHLRLRATVRVQEKQASHLALPANPSAASLEMASLHGEFVRSYKAVLGDDWPAGQNHQHLFELLAVLADRRQRSAETAIAPCYTGGD